MFQDYGLPVLPVEDDARQCSRLMILLLFRLNASTIQNTVHELIKNLVY